MHLKSLQLTNFKSFSEKSLSFSPKINAFVGNNGTGKTNVLDAIHYLCFFKSFLHHSEKYNIRSGEDFFRLDGLFVQEDKTDNITCFVKQGEKKVIQRNKKKYTRLSEHLGRFPAVIIAPSDTDLITQGSEIRRKFLDRILSQADAMYLADLIRYHKLLSQRNALLKHFAKNRTFDEIQLSIYDEEMEPLNKKIATKREEFLRTFSTVFASYYQRVSLGRETVSLQYKSNCLTETSILQKNRERDLHLHYTSSGIHRDDIDFLLDGFAIKKYGSQGQQKSFVIALKLAQLACIKEQLGKTPLLLLDDIFDKLDDTRVMQLVELVNQDHFGQIFLSDTHRERTETILSKINETHKIFEF